MSGVYVHIPYCRRACHYCDFHFSVNTAGMEAMAQAIVQELQLRKHYISGPVQSIYFGGGTPSYLDLKSLREILTQITQTYEVCSGAEITLEANPEDINAISLREWRNMGINRLSLGIQSFDDTLLTTLNRGHTGNMAKASFLWAREAGFDNISIDLMYTLPGQSLPEWENELHTALSLRPEHISAYGLTIEPKTLFGKQAAKGILPYPEEGLGAAMLETMFHTLTKAGYMHYEISNFALPGYRAVHNSNYWEGVPYLGVGPAAHSYNGQTRYANPASNAAYVQNLLKGQTAGTEEILSPRDHANEYLMTSLRTDKGTNLPKLSSIHPLNAQFDKALAWHLTLGNIVLENKTIYLSLKGKLVADRVTEDLWIVTTTLHN